jgi:hypothetical protein
MAPPFVLSETEDKKFKDGLSLHFGGVQLKVELRIGLQRGDFYDFEGK